MLTISKSLGFGHDAELPLLEGKKERTRTGSLVGRAPFDQLDDLKSTGSTTDELQHSSFDEPSLQDVRDPFTKLKLSRSTRIRTPTGRISVLSSKVRSCTALNPKGCGTHAMFDYHRPMT